MEEWSSRAQQVNAGKPMGEVVGGSGRATRNKCRGRAGVMVVIQTGGDCEAGVSDAPAGVRMRCSTVWGAAIDSTQQQLAVATAAAATREKSKSSRAVVVKNSNKE
jgi:hypothetical protein